MGRQNILEHFFKIHWANCKAVSGTLVLKKWFWVLVKNKQGEYYDAIHIHGCVILSHKWSFCISPISMSLRLREHCRTGGGMTVKTRWWEGMQEPVFWTWQNHCRQKFTAVVVAAQDLPRSNQSSLQCRKVRSHKSLTQWRGIDSWWFSQSDSFQDMAYDMLPCSCGWPTLR